MKLDNSNALFRIRIIGQDPDPDPLQETLIWIRVPKKIVIKLKITTKKKHRYEFLGYEFWVFEFWVMSYGFWVMSYELWA